MTTAPPLPKSFEESAQLYAEVEAELERICMSDQFRSSKRCCEFLQYIVRVTVSGRSDSLKERSIGIDLLGRDTSYDPSADSTVRVRANDVRKRLGTYYNLAPVGTLQIVLPSGTYVPQFVPIIQEEDGPLGQPASARRHRAFMIVIGLVLAIVAGATIQRITQDRDRYGRFWASIFTGKKIVLLSMSDETRDRLGAGLYPLVWLSGLHRVPTILTSGSITGATTTTFAKVRVSFVPSPDLQKDTRLHWLLEVSDNSILSTRNNKDGSFSQSQISHAALLTILPESPAILYAQSTDQDALRKLFEELCEREHFPANLATPTRGVMQVLLIVQANGHTTTQLWQPKH
jgi:hypothetical protein